MIVLGIDSASVSCSAAVVKYGKPPIESYGSFKNNGLTHSQTLLPMIAEVIEKAKIDAKDIDLIAITKGPGSFTGLRIGMATAKGIAAPFNTPCVCVSTLEAIAKTASNSHEGILCAVMDARCKQVYNAVFECKNGEITRLCDDRAISIADLEKELKTYDKPITLCGDGFKVCEDNFTDLKYTVADEQFRYPQGIEVCYLGKKYKDTAVSADIIIPTYLRLPQASRELIKKRGTLK